MILPEKLREKYRQRYGRYNSMVSTFHQLTLARFISEGYYEQHINRLRTIYRRKHAALLKAMDDVFGERIRVLGEGAGIHLMIDVDSPLPQCELADRAAKIGIRLYTDGDPLRRQIGMPAAPSDAGISHRSDGRFRRYNAGSAQSLGDGMRDKIPGNGLMRLLPGIVISFVF